MTNNNNDSNPSDPSGFINPSKQIVKIVNTTRENLNGKLGTAVSFATDRRRYNIAILPENPPSSSQSLQPTILSLKPDNLVAASFSEKVIFRSTEARHQAHIILNNPQVRRQFQTAYDTFHNRLPPGVTPKQVGYGLLAFLILSVYFFGFMKTFFGLSILSLPILVSAPDIMSGSDIRGITRNFPFRWRRIIVETTGFSRISERMALAGFVVFFLLCARILVTPSPKNSNLPIKPSAPSTIDVKTSTTSSFQSQLEEYYKIGFNDATEGHPFGKNMPEVEKLSSNTAQTSTNYEDDLDWAYEPPPQYPRKSAASKINFSTMMALMTIFRIGKDLIAFGPDGKPDLELFVTKLRMMQPMQMGFLGLSIYRIIHVFFF